MTQDISTIALQAVQALRQAQDTIDALRAQLRKQASYIRQPDQQLVSQVIAGLIKTGKLACSQAQPAATLLSTDSSAALRCIQQLLTDALYTKVAAQATADQLSVGKLISTKREPQQRYISADGRQAALRILKTEL